MKLLDGKVAIITGASSGIGQAAATLFAAHGASVVLVARREQPLKLMVEEIRDHGGHAFAVAGDVKEARTHEEAVAAAQTTFGGLHIAFNNAGLVGAMRPLAEIEPEQWTDVLAVNLTAAFLGARAQIPAMLRGGVGALIFTSSFVGNSVGLLGMTPYGVAKAGLMGWCAALPQTTPQLAFGQMLFCLAAPRLTWLVTLPSVSGLQACMP